MQTLILSIAVFFLSVAVISSTLLCRLYYKALSRNVDNLLYELFNLRAAMEILVKELEKSKNCRNRCGNSSDTQKD